MRGVPRRGAEAPPILERHPAEAVKTNVWGTLDLMELCATFRRAAVREHLHRQGRREPSNTSCSFSPGRSPVDRDRQPLDQFGVGARYGYQQRRGIVLLGGLCELEPPTDDRNAQDPEVPLGGLVIEEGDGEVGAGRVTEQFGDDPGRSSPAPKTQ